MDVIDIIKTKMKEQHIQLKTLALKAGLPIYTVANILKRTSKRFDYILKLLETLDIPFSVNSAKEGFITKIEDIDIYLKAHIIINALIHKRYKKHQSLSKDFLNNLIYQLYTYMLENGYHETLCKAYAEGLITQSMGENSK